MEIATEEYKFDERKIRFKHAVAELGWTFDSSVMSVEREVEGWFSSHTERCFKKNWDTGEFYGYGVPITVMKIAAIYEKIFEEKVTLVFKSDNPVLSTDPVYFWC